MINPFLISQNPITNLNGSAVMEHNLHFTEFCRFLQDELAVSHAELTVVIQRRKQASDPLPMLLWQYGFISLSQLQKIFDWLKNKPQFDFS